jgi:hypothetical protein
MYYVQSDISSIQSNISSLQSNMTSAQLNISSIQANITSLQANITSLQNQIDNFTSASSSSINVVPVIDSQTSSLLTNFGTQWSSLNSTPSSNYVGISCSSNGQYLIACSWNGGVYISKDFGQTWGSYSIPGIGGYAVQSAVSSTGQYMAVGSSWTGGNLSISKDYGQTWAMPLLPNYNSVRSNGIAISETGQEWASVDSNGNIYVSDDFAETWTKYTISPVSSLNAVSISIDVNGVLIVYACGDSGIWKLTPSVSNTPTQIYDISNSYNPAYPFISISSSNNGKYILACKNRNGDHLYVSNNGGISFSQNGSVSNWAGVAMSANGQYMTACVNNGYIYISKDFGQNFSTGLSSNGGWYSIAMSANANYIYCIAPWSNVYMYNAMMTTITTSQISHPGKGSMYFDESANKLYVYNSSTSAWKSVSLS